MQPQIIVTLPEVNIHASATPSSYQEYIRYINRNLPEMNDVDRFAAGYHDYLQAPLQPLMDNLDNSMYETFERDPIKYQQYEKVIRYLLIYEKEKKNQVLVDNRYYNIKKILLMNFLISNRQFITHY